MQAEYSTQRAKVRVATYTLLEYAVSCALPKLCLRKARY